MGIYDRGKPLFPQGLHHGNATAKALRSEITQVCVYLINESQVKSIAHPHCSAISYFLMKWFGGSSWILPWLGCQTIILPAQTSYWVQRRAALLNNCTSGGTRGILHFIFIDDCFLSPRLFGESFFSMSFSSNTTFLMTSWSCEYKRYMVEVSAWTFTKLSLLLISACSFWAWFSLKYVFIWTQLH